MRFFEEIAKMLGAEAGSEVQYSVAVNGGYFQNVKRLECFTGERIVLKGKKGGVCIEGRELSLGKYGGGDAAVKGEILRVERI